ncbi:MAG: alanine--tRNA ligase [Bifidobacteriaceae bacterium]|jgi:alanyl-tRNA synthetase|nr:alanine--tRNA ligase [Bifidobacteriaceae bacterium]
MRTSEIRNRFLAYFEDRDHAVVPSASLISQDPSLLFTVAGMVPFIPYMLGEVPPPWPRATSVQKCLRTGDIEEVGKTTRHGTFFQMNGNFSFGDYFKREAIAYAWELVTGAVADGFLGFDPDKIWVTVYHEDDEAAALWRSVAGLPSERIQRRGVKDNFWSTGQPGPAGPCSEIYVDRGSKFGPDGGPVVDEDRFLEIWNLVFMEFERGSGGAKDDYPLLGELERKNIDTGMGLERVAYLLQDAANLYEIDEVMPVIRRTEELTKRSYGADPEADVRMRVIADHVRSGLMVISDGVTPSNEGRGYVLRRLLRRAVRSVRLLGVEEPVFPELFEVSKNAMMASYPELGRDWKRISATAIAEEESFLRTLAGGSAILDVAITQTKAAGRPALSGQDAFQLHDTYGFPVDLTLEIAAEQGLAVDQQAFRTLMKEQKERARADAAAKKTGHADTSLYQELAGQIGLTDFTGYTAFESAGRVLAVIKEGQGIPLAQAPASVELVLDKTPFYAEAGGQLADQGTIEFESGAVFEVDDVQRPIRGLTVHRGRLTEGTLATGDLGYGRIDVERRRAISRAHTATHMVHQSLREHLGSTATQAGSENAPSRLRFDFRYGTGVPQSVLGEIEERVNSVLAEDLEVTEELMPLDKARELGAMALFGEKYGEIVRVVSIGGDWSRELCAGTHMRRSGELGRVSLLGEASIGSGVRRVEALVADGAYAHQAKEHLLVSQLTEVLRVRPDELVDRVGSLVAKLKEADRALGAMRAAKLAEQAPVLAAAARTVAGVRLVTATVADAAPDDLRNLAVDIRSRLGDHEPVVVALGARDPDSGRGSLAVAANGPAQAAGHKAGALVGLASKVLGGGGGGKPALAQGGGTDGSKLEDAWAAIAAAVTGVIASVHDH